MDFVRFVKTSHERDSVSGILILFGFICVGFVLAGVVQMGMFLISFMSESGGVLDLESLDFSMDKLTDSKSDWWLLVIMQGLSSIVMFVLTALAYWYLIERKKWGDFNSKSLPVLAVFLFVFLIQLSFLPFNSYLGSINESIRFPEALSGLEEVFRGMEESTAQVVAFIAKSDTISELFMSIIVIGVVAGIGEELIFRGILQRKLMKGLKNYHVAVWVAAFIFSAIHFQFYGFFPRLMLGVLFGYLYVWTGNIWIPILAHIFNNTLAVILYHFINKGVISPELEKMDTIPFQWVVVSTLIFVILVYIFYNQQKRITN